jgi:hypothetical protein
LTAIGFSGLGTATLTWTFPPTPIASDMVLTNNASTQQYNILYDVNGDGAVNIADAAAVRLRINTKLPQ